MRNAFGQCGQAVIAPLVVQFAEEFHANDLTVAPLCAQVRGPVKNVRFQQHAAAVDIARIQRRAHAQIGHAVQRLARQPVHAHHKNAAGRRPPGVSAARKAQIQRAKTIQPPRHALGQRAAQLAPVHHMPADGPGPAQQRRRRRHVARGQRGPHGGGRHALAMHFIRLHARHIKTQPRPGRIQHGVVARTLRAEAKVIAHQHIAHAQPAHQHLLDELLRRQRRQRGVKGQHDGLADSAAGQLGQLVAQRTHPRRGQTAAARGGGKPVARMRLERHHTTGHAPVPRLVLQQRQHGLMAPVHAVEVAYRQRATGRNAGVMQTAKNLHAPHPAQARPQGGKSNGNKDNPKGKFCKAFMGRRLLAAPAPHPA